jgi:hypothetical protein
LATFVIVGSITDVNAQTKKKEKPPEPATQSGISPALRDQAKGQSNSVGGKNCCTAWHQQTGAPCQGPADGAQLNAQSKTQLRQ